MMLAKNVASLRRRRQCVLASTFTAFAMTACTAGLIHAQVGLTSNHPSRDGGSNAADGGRVESRGKLANYSKLPLSFAANQGQSDPRVRFTSRGSGYSLFLTDNEAVLALSRTAGNGNADSLPKHGPGKSPAKVALKTDVVRMQLAGAKSGLRVSGEQKLPGTANYFIGNDPAKWHTDVPTYSKVKYSDVYPGVDLVYYGNQGQLEYDFVVAPGADPKEVKLHFAGAKLKLNANGDLMVEGRNGGVAFEKPVVYQFRNGSSGDREEVNGRFTLLASNTVGFSLNSYDKSRAVVIDPILAYSTYLGGSTSDQAAAIAVDASGNAYLTGFTKSTDFPVTEGAFQTSKTPVRSIAFVTKMNSTGTALVYSTYLGGTTANESGSAIALDAAGEAYVTGQTAATDFPVTPGAFQTVIPNLAGAGFVTKLNSTGTGLVYSTYLGGSSGFDGGAGVAVDASGDAYVTGTAQSTDFPTTPGAFQTVNKGELGSAFVTKLNASGTGLDYSTFLGGGNGFGDKGAGVAVDSSGEAYVTGSTSSTDFPVTAGAFQTVNSDQSFYCGFVTKLNTAGTALIYSSFLCGNDGEDSPLGIAVDTAGDAYVTGESQTTNFPVTAGAFQTINNSADMSGNAFVTKFNPTGTALMYSTYLGGTAFNRAFSIAVDPQGYAYVTGEMSTNIAKGFPITASAIKSVAHAPSPNAFLAKLNQTGTAWSIPPY